MPYTNSQSLTADDANNMVRGLYRDNTSHAVTGTTNETDLASLSIAGGTIGTTGGIHVIAAGTITNAASGAKNVKLKLGTTTILTVSRTGVNAQPWFIDVWCFNTAANAQRWADLSSSTDATTVIGYYTTSAIDTASTQTLKLTGTLADGADTITQAMFDVFVVQII